MEDERYAFEVEWFDAQAELMRRYIFTYFVRHSGTNEIEMVRLPSPAGRSGSAAAANGDRRGRGSREGRCHALLWAR